MVGEPENMSPSTVPAAVTNQSDLATIAAPHPAGAVFSGRSQEETTTAPSTTNAAGEQPAALPSADDETEIAVLAYQYYEEEGRPEGRSREHWARAAEAVRGQRVSGAEGVR